MDNQQIRKIIKNCNRQLKYLKSLMHRAKRQKCQFTLIKCSSDIDFYEQLKQDVAKQYSK